MTKARVNANNVTADIAGVTASTGLSGGGTTGTVTLSTHQVLTHLQDLRLVQQMMF